MEHGQLWDAGVLGPLPWAWVAVRLAAQGPLCVGRWSKGRRAGLLCVRLSSPYRPRVFLGQKERDPGQ